MTTLIPLYVHPAVDPPAWRAVAAAGPGSTAIINVHNGPGLGPEAAYEVAVEQLRTAGIPMIGYVDLDYCRRAETDVLDDVAGWQRYPVQGVFFDQVPSSPSALDEVARYARQVPGTVVLNPGTRPDPGYATLADLVCTFEGPWSAYRRLPDEPDWPNAAHLVYGVPTADLDQAQARLSRLAGAGLVSDLDAPLPYCGVPSWLGAATVRR
jgi:hypothetical protein